MGQSESGVKEATKFLGDIYKALIKDCVSDDNMVRIEEEIMPKCEEYGLDKVAKEAKKALNTLLTKKLDSYIKAKLTSPVEDEFIPKVEELGFKKLKKKAEKF